MARRPNPNSSLFLKRQVAELAAVNEALADKLAAFVVDHEEMIAELRDEHGSMVDHLIAERDDVGTQLKEVVYERDRYKGLWDRESTRSKQVEEDRKRYEAERDDARRELVGVREILRAVEAERDIARTHAEMMRERALPGSRFPWEGQVTERVGMVSHSYPAGYHRDWR